MTTTTTEIWITQEQMERLCSPCAQKMRHLSISKVNLRQMPAALLAGLCDKFGGEEGFITGCMASAVGDIADDPGALCAWLKDQCHPGWRSQTGSGNLERRTVPSAMLSLEEREKDKSALRIIIPYNALSQDLGGFRETIAPGAFGVTIREDDIVALKNHNPDLVLGRRKPGTLRFQDGPESLEAIIDLPNTQTGRDLREEVKRGDIEGGSFSFQVTDTALDQKWERVGASDIRTLIKVRLGDVSAVTFPAYPDIKVARRSLEAWRSSLQPSSPLAWLLRARRQRLMEADV